MKLTDGDIVELEGGATVQLSSINCSWFARPCDPETLTRDDSGEPFRVRERIVRRVCAAAARYSGMTVQGGEVDPLRRTA